MGWQATDDSRPGEEPGAGGSLPGLLAGFEHGGAWDGAAPSAALAAALEAAAGPDDLHEGADTAALVGIVPQWAAIESWAAASMLAALRAMMCEDSEGTRFLRRRSDLPDGWDDSLNYEIAGALAMGPVSAGNLAGLAWTLGTRLPGIGALLADGTLTRAKAKLVAQTFEPLDTDEAKRAEALVMGELAGKTYFQVERLAWRAALVVAPDVAQRRRSAAERERARVTVFREESGAVGLSGRDLPAAEALSGHASVLARAGEYDASGAFCGQTLSRLQALAYLDLLNGVAARDRIAFASAAGADPAAGPVPDDGESRDRDVDGGPDPDDNAGPDDGDSPDDGDGGPGEPGAPTAPRSPLAEVTVPLATLQGRAERSGDNPLLGPLDPAVTGDLAAAAARCPDSRWEVTIVDEHGCAVGHGVARPRRGRRHEAKAPGRDSYRCALPARVNITVTETLQQLLAVQAAQPRSGAPPGDWEFTPRKIPSGDGEPDGYGTWALTLPGGQQFTHAVPYAKGGISDACNAGARSRRCHQVKQAPGWTVTQPKPGWHLWVTPAGRTYTQGPWRYPA